MALTKFGYIRGETFETATARALAQEETGRALAAARADRGQWITPEEDAALLRDSRWGSSGYPVVKTGRKWRLESPLAKSHPLYPTEKAAVAAWETLLATLRALKGLKRVADAAALEVLK